MKYIINIDPYSRDLLQWGLAVEEGFDEYPRLMAQATARTKEDCIVAACAHLRWRTNEGNKGGEK